MIRDDQVWMIDFQGLRRGRQEYDLASLVYDPYLDHTLQEREALLDLWEQIADERPEPSLFKECAAQRLMQAIGAYSMILAKRGDEWYRPHIASAARLLAEVTAGGPLEEPLAPVLEAVA
jgi:aminoglycoside/choline kinase family phosphotransferase